jgi:hypothetical protein
LGTAIRGGDCAETAACAEAIKGSQNKNVRIAANLCERTSPVGLDFVFVPFGFHGFLPTRDYFSPRGVSERQVTPCLTEVA